MHVPCVCHAFAMRMPCLCHAYGMTGAVRRGHQHDAAAQLRHGRLHDRAGTKLACAVPVLYLRTSALYPHLRTCPRTCLGMQGSSSGTNTYIYMSREPPRTTTSTSTSWAKAPSIYTARRRRMVTVQWLASWLPLGSSASSGSMPWLRLWVALATPRSNLLAY